MIRTTAFEARQRQERLDAKTLDNLFRRRIEEGAKCSPFVSAAILQIVKDVFPLDPNDLSKQLALGQIKVLVAAGHEPPGKSLEECQKVTVLLTLDTPEDWTLRAREGVTALRRSRILRLTSEALDQGGLLSYEDLAYRLLNCGLRTIVRDVGALRRRGLEVPSRGQQQDIGPGQTHRIQAVRLFLQGKEPKEIARALYHSLSSIENYVTTFARVVFLAEKGYGTDEIAFVIRRSSTLVAAYRQLHQEFHRQRSAQPRLREILGRIGESNRPDSAKKGGQPNSVRHDGCSSRPSFSPHVSPLFLLDLARKQLFILRPADEASFRPF